MYSPADQYVSMAEISFVWQILYYLRHINQQKEKEKTANRFRCAACETKLPLFLPAATLWFLFRFEFGYAWSVSIVRIHFCYCFFLSFTSLLLIFFCAIETLVEVHCRQEKGVHRGKWDSIYTQLHTYFSIYLPWKTLPRSKREEWRKNPFKTKNSNYQKIIGYWKDETFLIS